MTMPQKFVDQRQFRELAAAGDTAGVGIERPARVLRTGDEESRTVRFCLSDSSVDRMGDTIRAAGWRLGPYKANPVVLWSHMSSAPPIGRMVNVWVSGDRLLGDVRFPDAATYEFGDQVFRLIKAGYINAGSVGFWPLKFSFSDDEDRQFGIDFHEQKLLEFSVTPVPANANALVQAAVKSLAVRGAALAERPTPVLSTHSFAGTARDRRWFLAHHLRQAIKKG
jgi:HK97 family phage prohead protease